MCGCSLSPRTNLLLLTPTTIFWCFIVISNDRSNIVFGGKNGKRQWSIRICKKEQAKNKRVCFFPHTHYVAHYSYYIAKCSYEKQRMARNEVFGNETSADLWKVVAKGTYGCTFCSGEAPPGESHTAQASESPPKPSSIVHVTHRSSWPGYLFKTQLKSPSVHDLLVNTGTGPKRLCPGEISSLRAPGLRCNQKSCNLSRPHSRTVIYSIWIEMMWLREYAAPQIVTPRMSQPQLQSDTLHTNTASDTACVSLPSASEADAVCREDSDPGETQCITAFSTPPKEVPVAAFKQWNLAKVHFP